MDQPCMLSACLAIKPTSSLTSNCGHGAICKQWPTLAGDWPSFRKMSVKSTVSVISWPMTFATNTSSVTAPLVLWNSADTARFASRLTIPDRSDCSYAHELATTLDANRLPQIPSEYL